jgi:hypothetical protein
MPLCSSVGNNLGALITAGSCQALDVIFSGFNYTQGATNVTAAQVTANLTTFMNANLIVTGFGFSPVGGLGGTWDSPISVGYTATLCDATCTNPAPGGFNPVGTAPNNVLFTAAQVQEFTPFRDPAGNPILVNMFVGDNSSMPLPTSNVSNATLTNSGAFPLANRTVTVSSTSGTGNMNSVEDDLQQSFSPEPGALLLVGGGLMLVGLKMKKVRQ